MATTNVNRLLEGLALTKADLPTLDEAYALWAEIRAEYGFRPTTPDLLAEGANVKIAKNKVRTWTLTLSPADHSGEWNTCTWSPLSAVRRA